MHILITNNDGYAEPAIKDVAQMSLPVSGLASELKQRADVSLKPTRQPGDPSLPGRSDAI